jgi:small-conductance mechanosensitive channel
MVGTHSDMRSECASLSDDPELFIFGLFYGYPSFKNISLSGITTLIVLFLVIIVLVVWVFRRL